MIHDVDRMLERFLRDRVPLRAENVAFDTPSDTFQARLSRTGALGAARRIAEKERDAALAALERIPQGPTRDLLAHVARTLLSRSH